MDLLNLILASALVSAIVSGIIQFAIAKWQAGQHFRHRYEELLVNARVEACRELAQKVSALVDSISPISNGTKGFEPPKVDGLGELGQRNEIYERVQKRLAWLEEFVVAEELTLGKSILTKWHFFSGAFLEMNWQAEEKAHRKELFYALEHLTSFFSDQMRDAAEESLRNADFHLLSVDDRTIQRKAGHAWFRLKVDVISADPNAFSIDAKNKRLELEASKIARRQPVRPE